MHNQTRITGTIWVEGRDGIEREFEYVATYGEPVRMDKGLLITFRADIEGIEEQPSRRSVLIIAPGSIVAATLIRSRIESSLIEHVEEVQN